MRGIEKRIAREAEAMLAKITVGEKVMVCNVYRHKSPIKTGFVAWLAALRLIKNGAAVELAKETKRITKGRRPHTRFRTTLTIARTIKDQF